ncbi:hypothetical protein F942_02272 [Acinetobacter ursingii ANC 3649]|uniref:YbaK/aminoacyl-tRNA synthetase-associated domain-containing protein n=1 Tax=Acinetobacter ursingii ANC 3649 TaxID=1257043 RepID=N9DDN6_9GAMM|nr:hypothetical protein F942_02272 [Acinetobacter ursingii ANC 3649]
MFITSFGEQNITYKCCSNFLIHLFDASAEMKIKIYVSGGKRGLDIGVAPQAIAKILDAQFVDILDQ